MNQHIFFFSFPCLKMTKVGEAFYILVWHGQTSPPAKPQDPTRLAHILKKEWTSNWPLTAFIKDMVMCSNWNLQSRNLCFDEVAEKWMLLELKCIIEPLSVQPCTTEWLMRFYSNSRFGRYNGYKCQRRVEDLHPLLSVIFIMGQYEQRNPSKTRPYRCCTCRTCGRQDPCKSKTSI